MTKLSFAFGIAFFVLVAAILLAAYAESPALTIQGTIIDNMCAGHAGKDLEGFIKTHTKECALMPACVASGYSIFSDGKLYKLDALSNTKVEAFLRQDGNMLEVTVVGRKNGELLEVISIENRK